MEPQTPTERMIQEYVPGKQVTLAHLIANPGKDLFKKLGLPDAVSAIGILTITPSEASIIACDIATKSGAVEIGFLDRFTGAGGVDRRCLRRGVRAQAGHPHPR
ncbi:propanediol utilization polyhedral body protein PduU [Klebsiella pneumoniae]|uniref:Propanediol utilization polyhedral body protein PduU n=1 Tax=Klebsiella pneumoniae TaxID=573 RepID=A0A2X3FEA5_KLEPN|nr:propanediol utilization polyhedral body protein PduU [Klebsiella pneumoniae]